MCILPLQNQNGEKPFSPSPSIQFQRVPDQPILPLNDLEIVNHPFRPIHQAPREEWHLVAEGAP